MKKVGSDKDAGLFYGVFTSRRHYVVVAKYGKFAMCPRICPVLSRTLLKIFSSCKCYINKILAVRLKNGNESMLEVAHAGAQHGDSTFVGFLDGIFIAHTAARLYDGCHAILGS